MIGQHIGKYRVLERIGRGGMGTVYRAVDETLHRDVAIKVLNAELNDPEVARRFRAEAITVARLSHPGIATIFELFHNDGQWLMVMEFVRGETLEHLVGRLGPLAPERTAELCMQTLSALAHAHSMGVIHRDLKPANLMITESGVVKIMDFGIARVAGTEHLTSAGFMMGTPAYMAPEQVMGQEIDARADLYAMGVVFYRLTSGKLPFKGDTPFAMAQSQVNDPPTPIGLFRADLPAWVETITARALAKNPDERFQTAMEFHEVLARSVAGTPAAARLTGTVALPSAPADYDPTAATVLGSSPSGAVSRSGPISGAVLAPSGAVARPPAPPPGTTAPAAEDAADETALAPALPVAPASGAPAPIARSVDTPAGVPSHDTPAAAQSATQSATKSHATKSQKKNSGPLLAIAAAAVLVLALGGWWFTSRPAAPAPAADTSAPSPDATPAPATTAESTASTPAPTPEPASPAPASSAPSAARSAAPPPRSAAAAPAAAAPAAAAEQTPPVDDTPRSFAKSRALTITGRKGDDEEVTLTFGSGQIAAVAKKGGGTLGALPYASIAAATYVRDKDPQWNASFASPPAGLEIGGLFRGTRNWLVLQSRESYLILRLDDEEARPFLQVLTERTGVEVAYPRAK